MIELGFFIYVELMALGIMDFIDCLCFVDKVKKHFKCYILFWKSESVSKMSCAMMLWFFLFCFPFRSAC